MAPAGPHRLGRLTDVPGVRVGQVQDQRPGALTGVTVVLPPPGTVAAVDVRGGAPATAETDALGAGALVPHAHAVVLSGGSAFGLAAADGARQVCEQAGRGWPVGADPAQVVPVVPAASIFDLGRGGDFRARPDAALGRRAATAAFAAAEGADVATGCVGAGTGAVSAGLRGGVGTASRRLPGGVVVAALAVVNAAGAPFHEGTGELLAARLVPDDADRPGVPDAAEHRAAMARLHQAAAPPPPGDGGAPAERPVNTTLVVVATNARLDRSSATRTATAAHAGLPRALRPVHTLVDGDVVFVLATGEVDVAGVGGPARWGGRDAGAVAGLLAVGSAAADVAALAVLDAVLSATSTHTPALEAPCYREMYPSAVRG